MALQEIAQSQPTYTLDSPCSSNSCHKGSLLPYSQRLYPKRATQIDSLGQEKTDTIRKYLLHVHSQAHSQITHVHSQAHSQITHVHSQANSQAHSQIMCLKSWGEAWELGYLYKILHTVSLIPRLSCSGAQTLKLCRCREPDIFSHVRSSKDREGVERT